MGIAGQKTALISSTFALSSAFGFLPYDFLEHPYAATHDTHLALLPSLRFSTFALGFVFVHDVKTEAAGQASVPLCRQTPKTYTRTEGSSERFARFEAFDCRY